MFSPSVLPKIQGDFRGSDVKINTERYRSGHNGADSKGRVASSGLWVRIAEPVFTPCKLGHGLKTKLEQKWMGKEYEQTTACK